MKRTTLWILLLSVAVAGQDEPTLKKRLDALSARLEERRAEFHIPGLAIAVVKDDKVIFAQGFGHRDLEKKLPATPETMFAIGSTTKAFTATLIGMLGDDGKMDWDDPVKKHIPYFKLKDEVADAQITIRDLLCHRSGLTRLSVLWAANRVDRETILRQVREAEPYAPFRKRFLYNNVMYLAAGVATANAAGTPWAELLKQRIFEPLGMKRSHTSVAAMGKDPLASRGYLYDEDKEEWDERPMRELHAIAPAGAINSSVNEMARWVRFLLGRGVFEGKRLISEERLAETWKAHVPLGAAAYGFGWLLHPWRGREMYQHGGNIDGFAAMVALIPEEKLGFVLLINVKMSPLQEQCREIVFEALLGDPFKAERAGRKLTPEQLKPFLGTYHVPTLRVEAKVLVKDGRLAVDVPGQTVYVLKWPDKDNRWVFELTSDIALTFEEAVDGKVPALIFHQVGSARLAPAAPGKKVGADPPPPGKKWSEAQLAPLIGKYRLRAANQDWKLIVQGGELTLVLPGQPPHPLHWPDDEGRWKIKVAPKQSLRFHTGEDGTVEYIDFKNMTVTRCPRSDAKPKLDVTVADLLKPLQGSLKPTASTLRLEGEVRFVHQGASGEVVEIADGPGRFKRVMDLKRFGHVTTVVVGEQGWVDSDIQPSVKLTRQQRELLRLENPLVAYGDWPKQFEKVTVVGKDEYKHEPVYIVRCVPRNGAPPLKKWVSAKTGLVLREERLTPVKGLGNLPMTVTLGDYRKVAGIMIPFRSSLEAMQMGRIEFVMKKVEENAKVLPEEFKRPAR